MSVKAANKTTICSVVFLDIVEYTKKSVSEQIKLKDRFNALISQSIKHVPATDRIILDTGDGAAISFLGDPEDALLCAMKLRDALFSKSAEELQFYARIGINLGPVRLVQDLNRQTNMIGDGINVAQRVMSFAQPNQILVSRAFYEVISCMTDDYARLFEYQGSRTDKHVREHEIYAVKSEFRQEDVLLASSRHAREEKSHKPEQAAKAAWWNDRNILIKRVLPISLLLVASLAVLLRTSRNAEKPAPPSPPAAEVPAASAPLPVAAAPEKKVEEKHHVKPHKKAEEAKSAGTATFVFMIMPWGEVYVDGKNKGVTPPLKKLKLPAGPHLIEVKNTTFKTFSQTFEPKAGDQVIIKYKFQ